MDKNSHPRPIDIPELLARVADFVPLWERDPNYAGYPTFRPKSVLSCFRVSRLWHLYDKYYTKRAPHETITRHSHLLQVFRTPDKHVGPFHCRTPTKLHITVSWSGRPEETLPMEAQRDLVRQNPQLRHLNWSGPESNEPLDPHDFERLTDLKVLRLWYWNGSQGRLADVLQAVTGSLRPLQLDSSLCPRDEDLSHLCLSKVENLWLHFDVSNIICCPRKHFISTVRDVARSGSNLANRVKVLSKLSLQGCSVVDLAHDQVAAATTTTTATSTSSSSSSSPFGIGAAAAEASTTSAASVTLTISMAATTAARAARATTTDTDIERGLRRIYVRKKGMDQVMIDSIVAHTNTLQKLTLVNLGPDTLLLSIAQVLAQCRQLRQFKFRIVNITITSREVVDGLTSQAWSCRRLKRLNIDFNPPDDDEGDNDNSDDDSTNDGSSGDEEDIPLWDNTSIGACECRTNPE
ncbi:hypothetical protein BGX29_009141 [Mortierella sp. GBA35]|nr:hypothetical protein BGX29_009141 [Mortierella sp. GBA35]